MKISTILALVQQAALGASISKRYFDFPLDLFPGTWFEGKNEANHPDYYSFSAQKGACARLGTEQEAIFGQVVTTYGNDYETVCLNLMTGAIYRDRRSYIGSAWKNITVLPIQSGHLMVDYVSGIKTLSNVANFFTTAVQNAHPELAPVVEYLTSSLNQQVSTIPGVVEPFGIYQQVELNQPIKNGFQTIANSDRDLLIEYRDVNNRVYSHVRFPVQAGIRNNLVPMVSPPVSGPMKLYYALVQKGQGFSAPLDESSLDVLVAKENRITSVYCNDDQRRYMQVSPGSTLKCRINVVQTQLHDVRVDFFDVFGKWVNGVGQQVSNQDDLNSIQVSIPFPSSIPQGAYKVIAKLMPRGASDWKSFIDEQVSPVPLRVI